MKKIYVVFGTSGEYSDYREWPVACYEGEAMAIQHGDLATQYSEIVFENWRSSEKWPADPPDLPYDPDCPHRAEEAQYFVRSVPVRTCLPLAMPELIVREE